MRIPVTLPHCHFDQIDSTNTQAKRWLRTHLRCPGVIVTADRQTAGRGSNGRHWLSEDSGGLYYTLGLNLSVVGTDWMAQHSLARLPYDVATLCQTVLHRYRVNADIEWPNDLILNGKKVGGILVETVTVGNAPLAYVMIGIGLNVNQTGFPDWIQSVATSMWQVDGINRSKTTLQMDLTKELLAWL